MFVPDTKFGRGSQYATVPDMMGIEYMTKKSNAVVRNLVQTTALLNCFFITKKIVIEELLQKCLHLTLSINLAYFNTFSKSSLVAKIPSSSLSSEPSYSTPTKPSYPESNTMSIILG